MNAPKLSKDTVIIIVMSIVLLFGIAVIITACKTPTPVPPVQPTIAELRMIASQWITQAPTYAFDGSDLTFTEFHALNSQPAQYALTYIFNSSHGGYGDHTGQLVTQMVTSHVIVVNIEQGKVVSAVIDDDWDEMNQMPVNTPPAINQSNETSAQIANPASVNCVKNGGNLTINDTPEGQVGYCTLPNGKTCEEWALFRGECS